MKTFNVNKNEIMVRNGLLFFALCGLSYFTITSDLRPFVIFVIEIIFMFSLILSFLYAINKSIIIDEEHIIFKTLFSQKVLYTKDIRGYRLIGDKIIIEPLNIDNKPIDIEDLYDNHQDIIKWLSCKTQNLDKIKAVDRLTEAKEIALDEFLLNPKFGTTIDERKQNLTSAKRNSNILLVITSIIAIWTMLIGTPIEYCVVCSLSIPILSIFLVKLSKGFIRFGIKQKDESNETLILPSVILIIIISLFGLQFRLMTDYVIQDYTLVMSGLIILSISLVIIYQELKKNYGPEVKFYIIFVAFYIYVFAISLNCVFDKEEFKIYKYKVIAKEQHTGKISSYFLITERVENQPEIDRIGVIRPSFEKVSEGQFVEIMFKNGLLHIPWYKNQDNILVSTDK